MYPPGLMIAKCSAHICSGVIPTSEFRWRNSTRSGRITQQRSALKVRGGALCAPRPSLSLPLPLSTLLGIRASPHCLQIMYISSYSPERMHFPFFVGAKRWREYGPQTTDDLRALQADLEIFENNSFGNFKSQIGHLAKVTCPSVQRLQLMGRIVLRSQATEAASCWRALCGLPV